MKLYLRLIAALFLTAALGLAASPKYRFVFTSPKAIPGEFVGKKVAAFVMIPDENLRKGREETLAEELRQRGINCYAGAIAVPDVRTTGQDKAKEILQKKGYVGAVLMRLVADQEIIERMDAGWYQQSYYGGFSPYWAHGWSAVYTSGYEWKDRVITLETLIYSIDRDELLWAGRSETTNPKDIRKFVKELVEATSKELQKAGLVKK